MICRSAPMLVAMLLLWLGAAGCRWVAGYDEAWRDGGGVEGGAQRDALGSGELRPDDARMDGPQEEDASWTDSARPADMFTDATHPAEAGPPLRSCVDVPFPVPTEFAAAADVDTQDDEWYPSVSPDGLKIIFHAWDASLGQGLRVATRTSTNVPFGAAQELFDTTCNEFSPSISPDGRMVLFSVDSQNGKPCSYSEPLYFGELDTAGTKFTRVVPVDDGYGGYVLSPFLWRDPASPTQQTLYFSTGQTIFTVAWAGSATDLNRASPLVDAAGGRVSGQQAIVSADGRELYLVEASQSSGLDIYRGTRADYRTEAFSPPSRVSNLSSPSLDRGISLSPDGQDLYLNYYAPTSGGAGIYHAHRECALSMP